MQIDVKHYSWNIILNVNALLHQSSRFWKDIKDKLKEANIRYIRHGTATIEEAKDLIISLCDKGERHFILVGGDGSLNCFVNAVMESQVNSAEVFAALIPLGTGNDWSRTHGFSNRYQDAIDALVQGNFISHDVGLVESVINDNVVDSRYFVNIAGFGFDGTVIANAHKKTIKLFHKQLYLINLLKTLLTYRSQPITIKSNDFATSATIFSIAAGIGRYNGNGMCQCPEAIPNDGLLDVVIIEKVSVMKVLRNIGNLFKGAHVQQLKEVSMIRTNHFEITGEPYMAGEVEGEVITAGDYRIRCLASAINFMYVQ